MEKDRNIPILLEMAFLATCGTRIDVKKGKLKVRVKNKEEAFGIYKI